MGKSLVVVESPSKAKTIEKYLGKDFTVKASVGHVKDLPPSKLGVDIEKGFEPTYVVIKGKQKVLDEITALAKKAEIVYLATDPDREGEAIAWHIAEEIRGNKKKPNKIEIHPEGLNEGERQFILDLKDHMEKNSDDLKDKKIFVLRNFPKRGVGFFENVNFFPDFIIWIIDGTAQHILFVDPKGLVNIKGSFADEKIQLYNTIKELEQKLNENKKGVKVTLDSFIISVTEKHSLTGVFEYPTDIKYDQNHILFIEDPRYIEKMLKVTN